MGVQACRLPGLTRLKRLKLRLACLIPQPTGTPRPHQWLLLGVQACRLPGLKCLKGLKPLKQSKTSRNAQQAKATPRPHPWLLLGVQASRSPGVTRLKSFKRLNIFLACLIPQPTGTPRPHQWLLMGVQACLLPGLKRLKGLKPLKLCKSFSERPTGAGKSYPKATSMASSGRPSLPFARRYTLETLQTLQHPLGMPLSQPTGTPRPHEWLLMGVQACRLPGHGLKTLKPLQKLLGTPSCAAAVCLNPKASYPKATSMASSGRSSLPFARRYRLETLKILLGMPTPAASRHPNATSMASCGRPSLPFARPYTLKTLKTPLGIAQATGTPRPHQWLLMGVQACRLPGLKRLKGLKPLKLCKSFSERPTGAGKSYPKATSMASSGRSSLPFARRYTLEILQTL